MSGKIVGGMFTTPGVIERLQKALDSAAKANDTRALEILRAAIKKEIDQIQAIKDMPMFRTWIDGERLDLSKARARK